MDFNIISLFALLISIISAIFAKKKFNFDRGRIIGELIKIGPTTRVAAYPSMEDGEAPYEITVKLINTGTKDFFIKNIKYNYGIYNRKELDFSKNETLVKIVSKDQYLQKFEITRNDLRRLKYVEIDIYEYGRVKIGRKALKTNFIFLEKHIKQLNIDWKDGRRITPF